MIGMPMKGSPKGEDAPLIDTLLHIREVVVTARQPFHEVIPVQRLKGERLQQLNSRWLMPSVISQGCRLKTMVEWEVSRP